MKDVHHSPHCEGIQRLGCRVLSLYVARATCRCRAGCDFDRLTQDLGLPPVCAALQRSHHAHFPAKAPLDLSEDLFPFQPEQRSTSRAEMAQVLDRIDDGFVALDRDGRCVYVNRRVEEMLGRSREQMVGALASEDYPQLLATAGGRSVADAVDAQQPTTNVNYYPELGAWLQVKAYPAPDGVSFFVSDVSDAHLAQQRARLQTAALESAADMVVIVNTDHVVEYVNGAFVVATGYAVDEAVGRGLSEISSLDSNRAFLEEGLPSALRGEPWRGTVLNQRKDGVFYPEEQAITPILDESGACTHFVVIKRDRTEWKQREDQIVALTEYDNLTGLAKREVFLQKLSVAAATATEASSGAVLHFDVDRFHLLNDTLGHEAGDRLLCEIAELLRFSVRHTDVVSRLGGDQFAALLRRSGPVEAFALASTLSEKVERLKVSESGRELSPSVSVGIAIMDGTASGAEVLRRGAVACNAARVRGGNRVESYRPQEEELMRAADDGKWVARVRDALRDGRFTQHYQPIMSLRTSEIEHHEVLARLVDASRGSICAVGRTPGIGRRDRQGRAVSFAGPHRCGSGTGSPTSTHDQPVRLGLRR